MEEVSLMDRADGMFSLNPNGRAAVSNSGSLTPCCLEKVAAVSNVSLHSTNASSQTLQDSLHDRS